jgi:hypothetical protein
VTQLKELRALDLFYKKKWFLAPFAQGMFLKIAMMTAFLATSSNWFRTSVATRTMTQRTCGLAKIYTTSTVLSMSLRGICAVVAKIGSHLRLQTSLDSPHPLSVSTQICMYLGVLGGRKKKSMPLVGN